MADDSNMFAGMVDSSSGSNMFAGMTVPEDDQTDQISRHVPQPVEGTNSSGLTDDDTDQVSRHVPAPKLPDYARIMNPSTQKAFDDFVTAAKSDPDNVVSGVWGALLKGGISMGTQGAEGIAGLVRAGIPTDLSQFKEGQGPWWDRFNQGMKDAATAMEPLSNLMQPNSEVEQAAGNLMGQPFQETHEISQKVYEHTNSPLLAAVVEAGLDGALMSAPRFGGEAPLKGTADVLNRARLSQVGDVLGDVEAAKEARAHTAESVAAQLWRFDPEAARAFARNAADDIMSGRPVDLSEASLSLKRGEGNMFDGMQEREPIGPEGQLRGPTRQLTAPEEMREFPEDAQVETSPRQLPAPEDQLAGGREQPANIEPPTPDLEQQIIQQAASDRANQQVAGIDADRQAFESDRQLGQRMAEAPAITADKIPIDPSDPTGTIQKIAAAPVAQIRPMGETHAMPANVNPAAHAEQAGNLAHALLEANSLEKGAKLAPKESREAMLSHAENIRQASRDTLDQYRAQYGDEAADHLHNTAAAIFHQSKAKTKPAKPFPVQEKPAFTEREQPAGVNNAVREQRTESVLQRQPGEAGVAGGERRGVESGVQGQEAAGARTEAQPQGEGDRGVGDVKAMQQNESTGTTSKLVKSIPFKGPRSVGPAALRPEARRIVTTKTPTDIKDGLAKYHGLTARDPTDIEQKAAGGIIHEMQRNGVPDSDLKPINNVAIANLSEVSPGTLYAHVAWQDGREVLLIDGAHIADVAQGIRSSLNESPHQMTHEVGHSKFKNGDPLHAAIAREAERVYNSTTDADLKDHLAYPFARTNLSARDKIDEAMAQLHSLWYADRSKFAELPLAKKYFEDNLHGQQDILRSEPGDKAAGGRLQPSVRKLPGRGEIGEPARVREQDQGGAPVREGRPGPADRPVARNLNERAGRDALAPERLERSSESAPDTGRRKAAESSLEEKNAAVEQLRRESTGDEYVKKAAPARLDIAGQKVTAKAQFTPSAQAKDILGNGGIATPAIYELRANGADAFHSAITAAKESNKYGSSVYVYPKGDYAKMRMFITKDGKAGFALKGDDLVSAFNGGNEPGIAHALIRLGVQEGGRRLDAFDTVLPKIYAAHGFKSVARLPWDDTQAPADWNKELYGKFNKGQPDVVFMAHDPTHFGGYSKRQGANASDYDAAIEAQKNAIAKPELKPSTAVQVRDGAMKMDLPKVPEVGQVAMKFNELVKEQHGRALSYDNPNDVEMVTRQAVEEFKHQLQQADSGIDWYTDNVKQAWEVSAKAFPEFLDPSQETQRQLAGIVTGMMSPANEAPLNWYQGMENWAHYKETGKFLPVKDGWASVKLRPAVSQSIEHLNWLISHVGEDKAVDWLTSMHPVGELNELKHHPEAGTYKNAPVGGKRTDEKMGVEIYGPKVGPFILDVLGIDGAGTVDAWRTRTLRRWFGTAKMVADKERGMKLDDSPTEQERLLSQKIDAAVGQELGYKTKQVQSGLWFFEKQLYNKVGVKKGTESHTFLDGAKDYVNEHATGRPGPDAGEQPGRVAEARPAGERAAEAAPRSGGEVTEKGSALQETEAEREARLEREAIQSEPDYPALADEVDRDLDRDIGPGKLSLVQGLIPKQKVGVRERIGETVDAFKKLMAPTSRGPLAGQTADIIRHNLAQQAQDREIAYEMLRGHMTRFIWKGKNESRAFINAMEGGAGRGGPQLNDPKLQRAAEDVGRVLDYRREQVRALGTGALQNFYENYFPHIWKDPNAAAAFFAKRPLEGSKAFLKERKYTDFMDGINAGLEPPTENPMALALLKARELDRFIYGQRMFQELKNENIIRRLPWTDANGLRSRMPDGWEALNDKIARDPAGQWIAPEQAATIFNNHLSPGLAGNSIYDMIRSTGNMLNAAQLGLSAFHLGFTTGDAMISKAALGFMQASRGIARLNPSDVGRGVVNIARGALDPTVPFENLYRGNRTLNQYMGRAPHSFLPTPVNRALGRMPDANLSRQIEGGKRGGMRVYMDDFHRGAARDALMLAIHDGHWGAAAKAVLPTIMDATVWPIMQVLVPRQKLGVMMDLVQDQLRANPNMTLQQERSVMRRMWDSVDNRMGQLVYDNVFWKKLWKDVLMVTFRSVGWNFGDWREIPGGVNDLKNWGDIRKNGLSPRSAYIMSLALVPAIWGAITQYLYTGEPPRDWKDLYAPRTGKIRPDGSEDRVMFPTYVKDVLGYGMDIHDAIKNGGNPFNTVTNKLHPLISMIMQLAANKDFFGGAIRLHGSAAEDTGNYLAKQALPFGVRNYQQQEKLTGDQPTVKGYVTSPSFVGVTPAAGYITKNEKQAETAAILRNKDAVIQRLREDLRDGADPREIRQKALRNGLNQQEIGRVMTAARPARAPKPRQYREETQ